MEPEGSSPHSQAHATCPYPELPPSSPHTHFPKMTQRTTTTKCFYLELCTTHKQKSRIIPDIMQMTKNHARHSQRTYLPDHWLDVQAIKVPFLAQTTDLFLLQPTIPPEGPIQPHIQYIQWGFSEGSKAARIRGANFNNQWNCISHSLTCLHDLHSQYYLTKLYSVTCTLYNFRVTTNYLTLRTYPIFNKPDQTDNLRRGW
jgi:hypothetical protein